MTISAVLLITISFITVSALCTGAIDFSHPAFPAFTRKIAAWIRPYGILTAYLAILTTVTSYAIVRAIAEPEHCWYLIPSTTLGLPIAALLYQVGKQNPSDKSH